MVTGKKAEEFRFAITGGGLLGGVMPTGTDVVALCTTVIDTERDAALGAYTRPHLLDIASALDWYATDLMIDGHQAECDRLRAIATHLREEQKGGG